MNASGIPAQGGIDFVYVLERLLAKRWWIVGSGVLFTVLFGLIAFLSTPVYRAEVLLTPSNLDQGGMGSLLPSLGQLGGLASIAGIDMGGREAETEEALAVLKSRQFTESFIKDWNLMPVLFEELWDAEHKRWKQDVKEPTANRAYKRFDRVREVEKDKDSGLILLQVDWRDREVAAKWANELVRRLNLEMRSRAIAQADASVGYLEKELEGTSVVSTRDAINRLIEAQIKQRMLANVTQEYAFRVVDPATVPDEDDPIKPRKLLLLVGGALFGGVFGIFMMLVRISYTEFYRRGRRV